MKNKFKLEYLIYIYIFASPFLDASSGLFRTWLPSAKFNPVMVIRLIIPIILLAYIFFNDKKTRKPLVIGTVIYAIYGLIHILLFKNNLTGISYGTVFSEGLYLLNYTFNIYMLFIIMYFSKKNKLKMLKDSMFLCLLSYLIIIYFSILTGTSSYTYLTGVGYKSYFVSGNTLSTALLLLFSALITDGISKRNIKYLISFVLLGVFLIFLVGTRTGMLGFLLVLVIYVLLNIFKALNKKIKIDKIMVISGIGLFLSIGILLGLVGSNTLKRMKNFDSKEYEIIDVNTGEESHVTGDTSSIVYNIKNNIYEEGFLSEEQEKAYLKTYEICNKLNIKGTNLRVQQLIYHGVLVKEEHNVLYLLFGNGYHSQYGEMTLEMEVVALLLNFGLTGFILYLGPYLFLCYKVIKYLKKKKKISDNSIMYMFGIGLAIFLSFIAGYVFYSGTVALLIICLFSLLKEDGDYL